MGISKVQPDTAFEQYYITDGDAVNQTIANKSPRALKDEINFLDNFIKGNFGTEFLDEVPLWNNSDTYIKGQVVKHNNKRYQATGDIINASEPGVSSVWTLIHLDKIFDTIEVSSITYNGDDNIDTITYVTGNKTIMNYNGNKDISSADYYDTDGTTIIGTMTLTYDGSFNIINIDWN